LAGAASDAVMAVTLADEDGYNLARRAAVVSDSKNRVASPDNAYDARLQNLVAHHTEMGDRIFNFKVYLTEQVNAFAMADG
jgi:metalloprotease